MTDTAYRCWCDGSACSNPTAVPFTVCDECKRFGHQALPDGGLQPEDVRLDAERHFTTREGRTMSDGTSYEERISEALAKAANCLDQAGQHPDLAIMDSLTRQAGVWIQLAEVTACRINASQ